MPRILHDPMKLRGVRHEICAMLQVMQDFGHEQYGWEDGGVAFSACRNIVSIPLGIQNS